MNHRDINTYAARILALIDQDIADSILPANVRTYSDLHTYVDANAYLDHSGIPAGTSRKVNDLVAAVQEEVTRHLDKPGRSWCGFGTYAYPGHDLRTRIDADGNELDQPGPAECGH